MVAVAMLVAYFVLRADFTRRHLGVEPSTLAELFIAVPCVSGIIGARLYHVLQTPRDLMADPWGQLFSRYGLAWFGGLLAGAAAWIILAHRNKIPLLASLDAGSPAAALGYGIGRLGCLLSGDGDYGRPTNWHWPWAAAFPNGLVPTTQTCVQWGWPSDCRVFNTPSYELLASIIIAWLLWSIGSRQLSLGKQANRTARLPRAGSVFASYLILTGVERFLIEFIRINPRSFMGLTNAQVASVISILFGILLLFFHPTEETDPIRPGAPVPRGSKPHSTH